MRFISEQIKANAGFNEQFFDYSKRGNETIGNAQRLTSRIALRFKLQLLQPIQVSAHNNQNKMTEFELWYTYYDSLFINSSPTFPKNFCQAYHLIFIWPSAPCEALSESFRLLETFIKTGDNWITSQCTRQELDIISGGLNQLLYFLELQKKYANQFWGRDPRRVQASITRLYSFLQNLIRAIIPYSTMTIFECKAAHKLCVSLINLQSLFNKIFQKLSIIAEYLSDSKFSEQVEIIVNFFQNFICFMQQLPKIKRNKLNHVHNLAKFVIFSNPLEICIVPALVLRKNRKKSCTIGTVKELELSSADPVLRRKYIDNQYRKFGGYYYKVVRRSFSCDNIRSGLENDGKKSVQIILFKFPERINQGAVYEQFLKKKLTLDSFHTLTTKVDSIRQKNSGTISTISSPMIRQRKRTLNQRQRQRYLECPSPLKKKKSSTNKSTRKSQKSLPKYYDQEEERFEINSTSNRNRTDTLIMSRIQSAIETQKEQEKKMILVNWMENRKQVSMVNGEIRAKGWDLVRAYFWKRVKLRQIRRAMSLFC